MDRRGFLGTMIGGVTAAAAVRTWPFRVYSFPVEVITPVSPLFDQITATTLANLRDNILYDNFFMNTPWLRKLRLNTVYYYDDPVAQFEVLNVRTKEQYEIEIAKKLANAKYAHKD